MGNKNRIGCLVGTGGDRKSLGDPMLEICDRPAIAHLLDRVSKSWYVDRQHIVICVGDDNCGNEISSFAESAGFTIYRDAVYRPDTTFLNAAEAHEFDIVLCLDAARPLSDVLYMDLVIERVLSDETLAIARCAQLPSGTESICMMREALTHYAQMGNTLSDTISLEGVSQTEIHPLDTKHRIDGLNLTLSHDDEVARVRSIFDALYCPSELFGLAEIHAFMEGCRI